MAEKDASLAIENASQKLIQEVDIVGRWDRMKSLRLKLIAMSVFVKELDGQENKPKVREHLHKVRDIAYEAQDQIECLAIEGMRQDEQGKMRKLLSRRSTIKHHLETIGEIEKRMQSFPSFKDVVAASSNSDNSGNGMVFDEFRKNQETWVRQQLISEVPQRQVILIFGKKGLGKTTLAKMVYDNTKFNHFDCSMWVELPPDQSQLEPTSSKILDIIRKHTHEDCSRLTDELPMSLKRKKYLLVLDNLHNSEILKAIESSFPDDSNGSRILVMSGIEPAALCMSNEIWSYQVTPLDINQSWKLLKEQVPQGANDSCPPNLEEFGKIMAGTCKGSPRAIVCLAKVLNKADKQHWEQFSKDLENQGQILDYEDLPKELRLFFLYLGIFPAGTYILAKQIIQMWGAEGLLKPKDNIEAEEIGHQLLKELSERRLIQAEKRKSKDNAMVKTFCISKFTSCYCRTIGADEIGLKVKTESDTDAVLGKETLRLGIHNTSIQGLKSCKDNATLHSLHIPVNSAESISFGDLATTWKKFVFSRLRVLNMASVELDKVPKVIGELIHLRYLRLVAPNISNIPSFGKLNNLETLDMRESHLHSRLHGIWKMKNLRHVYLKSFDMPDPHGTDYYKVLPQLKTLSGVHPNKILKQLMLRAKFPNVTRLRVCSLDKKTAFTFLNSLDHLNHLQSLRVEKPINLPDSYAFPLSLSKLTLLKTLLKAECIKILEKLPYLKVLKLLENSITGDKIECAADGFPQLEVFCLEKLDLKSWILGNGAMQCLKLLNKEQCPKLVEIPKVLKMVAGTANFPNGTR